jgi:proteasome lid subunit RPN8/RPN11
VENDKVTATPIQWRDAEPDVSAQELSRLLRETNWSNAVAFIQNSLAGVSVYLAKQAEQAIDSHLASECAELGGLLLGRVFKAPFAAASAYSWITLIEITVPSNEYHNSSVSLRMGTEVWNRASTLLRGGIMVVGWYHSHPNLGVFFSGTDRATQSAFFNHPYALGLVIDPIRKQRKCFFGGASQELDERAMAVV